MGKGSKPRPCNKERYDRNYEAIFGAKEPELTERLDLKRRLKEEAREELNARTSPDGPYWTGPGHRGEWTCPHGRGHGNHIHGCDGCCGRDDYPDRKGIA